MWCTVISTRGNRAGVAKFRRTFPRLLTVPRPQYPPGPNPMISIGIPTFRLPSSVGRGETPIVDCETAFITCFAVTCGEWPD